MKKLMKKLIQRFKNTWMIGVPKCPECDGKMMYWRDADLVCPKCDLI